MLQNVTVLVMGKT